MKSGMTVALAATLLSACSSMTTLSAPHAGTQLLVKDRHLTLPAHENMRGTSFGNYEFKASEEGFDPFYGILPLSFKGGHLAADILLFAPGAFFNLRAVFPFYEIDVEKSLIRYRASEHDAWNEYHPKPEEIARARSYFEDAPAAAPAASSK
ncbi:MAG: hypothetical protein ABIW82_00010 [Dokdonella sp.]